MVFGHVNSILKWPQHPEKQRTQASIKQCILLFLLVIKPFL
jgi:hypothetical protein